MMFVYVLQNFEEVQRFYVGVTENPETRLKQHNAGEVFHTAKYKPWRLKNYVAFDNPSRAYAFEKYLKSGSGRAFAKRHF